MSDDSMTVATKPVRVTLFEDRAEVVRTARARVVAGQAWIPLTGVSPLVDETTLEARVVWSNSGAGRGATPGAATEPSGAANGAPEPRVLAARVRWRAHAERALGREAIEALERDARTAEERESRAAHAEDRAGRERARVEQMITAWTLAVAVVPRGAGAPEALARWRESHAELDAAAARALEDEATARRDRLFASDDRRAALRRRLQGAVETPRLEAILEVEVEALAAGEVELTVHYRLPCALWRPEHLARLAEASAEGAATIEIVTFATAWQRTGEAWEDVAIRFSTARPARAASPPLLGDDVLASRRKTEPERQQIVVSAREQAIAVAGLDRGARAVDEMPGVDDGGEPLTLAPRERVTLRSTGEPVRFEVGRVALPAAVERVLFPERAPVAHLRGTTTLTRGGPLLAGPVRVARGGSLVGRASLAFVGKGEPFEIGFGVDDGVRVRRSVDDERATTALIGTQRLKRTVRLYLSNLAGEPKRVLITERVPVSEIEDLEVTVVDAAGWSLQREDGFATQQLELPAQSERTLTLVYEIRASSKVVLPF